MRTGPSASLYICLSAEQLATAPSWLAPQRGFNQCEPGRAVIIIKGLAALHFRDVLGGMQVVASMKREAEDRGQLPADRGLAAAAGAGDDDAERLRGANSRGPRSNKAGWTRGRRGLPARAAMGSSLK